MYKMEKNNVKINNSDVYLVEERRKVILMCIAKNLQFKCSLHLFLRSVREIVFHFFLSSKIQFSSAYFEVPFPHNRINAKKERCEKCASSHFKLMDDNDPRKTRLLKWVLFIPTLNYQNRSSARTLISP